MYTSSGTSVMTSGMFFSRKNYHPIQEKYKLFALHYMVLLFDNTNSHSLTQMHVNIVFNIFKDHLHPFPNTMSESPVSFWMLFGLQLVCAITQNPIAPLD